MSDPPSSFPSPSREVHESGFPSITHGLRVWRFRLGLSPCGGAPCFSFCVPCSPWGAWCAHEPGPLVLSLFLPVQGEEFAGRQSPLGFSVFLRRCRGLTCWSFSFLVGGARVAPSALLLVRFLSVPSFAPVSALLKNQGVARRLAAAGRLSASAAVRADACACALAVPRLCGALSCNGFCSVEECESS
jgi:hypothetical protein